MKVVVMNGSPKGEISVTMQYIKVLENNFKEHEFCILHIAHDIRKIEHGSDFERVIEEVQNADIVVWAFPLYVCMVHGNYKRFIELVFERNAVSAFQNKYTAVLSTSIHFYDHTAHRYMEAVCNDLDMHYTGYFSAGMDDLFKRGFNKQFIFFFSDVTEHAQKKLPVLRNYYPVQNHKKTYNPVLKKAETDNAGINVLLISDIPETGGNIGAMTERFKQSFKNPVEHIDINRMKIAGGCLGCLRCGYDNHCAYGDSDDIKDMYENKIQKADVIVFALYIKDRYFSARFKTFVDRRFLKTHQPIMTGKQIGYIVSGPLSQIPNLYDLCEVSTELDHANLNGIVSDESKDSLVIDNQLQALAQKCIKAAKAKYLKPRTFLGVAGDKIFRDEIYLNLRFVFCADHLYYKKHGRYDFPQKQLGTRLRVGVMCLLNKLPPFRKYVQKNMKTLMLRSYKKAAEQIF